MKVVNAASLKAMSKFMKKEAAKKFTACNPEKCPKCRVSDG